MSDTPYGTLSVRFAVRQLAIAGTEYLRLYPVSCVLYGIPELDDVAAKPRWPFHPRVRCVGKCVSHDVSLSLPTLFALSLLLCKVRRTVHWLHTS